MGSMRIMGSLAVAEKFLSDLGRPLTAKERAEAKGDLPFSWDPKSETEVRYAREIYDHAKKKGFSVFENGARVSGFDPDAGELTLVAPMGGGALTFKWNSKVATEREFAEKIHRHAVTKGKFQPQAEAFKVKRGGKSGAPMPKFDPEAGAATLVFP